MTDAQHLTIREQLDAVRPDADDLADEALSAAARAVGQSQAWRDLLESQRTIDRQIADAMQDVELPVGFMERLQEALIADSEGNGPAGHPVEPPTMGTGDLHSRRNWLKRGLTLTAVAASLVAGVSLFFGRQGTLSLDDLRSQLPLTADGQIDLGELSLFDESFDLELPPGRWDRVQFDAPRGLDWTGDGQHDGAVMAFTTQARQPVRGYLLIVPATRIADPPSRTYLSAAEISYVPTENTAAVHPNGNLVYVCFTPPGQLMPLGRLLYPQAA